MDGFSIFFPVSSRCFTLFSPLMLLMVFDVSDCSLRSIMIKKYASEEVYSINIKKYYHVVLCHHSTRRDLYSSMAVRASTPGSCSPS